MAEEALTPRRLKHELDEIAGLADALVIVTEADDANERARRAVGAVAGEISRRLDALYADVHEALEDPASFISERGRRKR